MADLKNKKILVTGGSRGIGKAIVENLVAAGAQVAFTFNTQQKASEELASELTKRFPHSPPVSFLAMQMNDATSIEKGFENALNTFSGELSGLVNNAGIAKDSLFLRAKLEDLDEVFATNFKGSFYLAKLATKPMLKQKSGSIVQLTSVVGLMGNSGQSIYSASKGALESLVKTLALELGSRNIRVNAVAPGFIQTDMTESLTEEYKQQMLKNIPLSRLGQPQDVAYAVNFLLSDEAQYITGHTLSVNGGMYRG